MSRKRKRTECKEGQVICIRDGYLGEGTFHEIVSFEQGKDHVHARFTDGSAAVLYAIRPLTARQRGPR